MNPKLYIETSIISYLTARPSRNIITAARQELTRQWWEHEKDGYDLFVSEFVLLEAGAVAGGTDYLLTWNFAHLANAALRKRIDLVCRSNGYEPPVICTPEELMQP